MKLTPRGFELMKTTVSPFRAATLAAGAATALLSSGCLGPAYHRPAVETPSEFKGMSAASTDTWRPAAPSDALPRGSWWTLFGDPRLDDLERRAADANQSLKQARAQYLQSMELVSADRSEYFPSASIDASATRAHTFNTSGPYPTGNTFSLPVTASWEPDVWGQIGKTVDVAKANAQSSSALLENARLSLQAQLAVDYFSAEELDMESSLLKSAMDDYEKALNLTLARYGAGIASQADVSQARAQLNGARAAADDVALSRAKFEHAIAVLVGEPPASFSLSTAAITGAPPAVPVALPGQLLERRPDVASAERLAAAANATIGLARTAFFPTFTIAATGGFTSNKYSQWIDFPARVWSLGASAAGTILDFGGHLALYRASKDAYDAAAANYRQTTLAALQEVEDDLSALSYLAQEGGHQEAAVKAAEDALRLETDLYKAGTVSYLDVIQTQNIALTDERTAAQVLGRRMEAAVDLIKAVGGGWDQGRLPFNKPPAVVTAPPPKG
jgi:NodT family efflux transporter outer membrane factor (OMF) lipoprotein